jgi:HK97 gp10 family phage protein
VADFIDIKVDGDRELIARLDAMPAKIRNALIKKVTALSLLLEAKVKGDKLSGQVLNVKTGALRRSIFSVVTSTETSVTGKVASSGDVKYAAIHEFGGTINVPEITAKGKALAFMMGGKQVFFKKVAAHTVTMPERSFMRSSLKDMESQIREGLTQTVREAMREK